MVFGRNTRHQEFATEIDVLWFVVLPDTFFLGQNHFPVCIYIILYYGRISVQHRCLGTQGRSVERAAVRQFLHPSRTLA